VTVLISKELSPNDVGLTGSHQAGILIPKDAHILAFFPALDPALRNPRSSMPFQDPSGQVWTFTFIYYNNRLFGRTRNEYRLTGMTRFLRESSLQPGDTVVLGKDSRLNYSVDYVRRRKAVREGHIGLQLGGTWKIISTKGGSDGK